MDVEVVFRFRSGNFGMYARNVSKSGSETRRDFLASVLVHELRDFIGI